MISSVTFEGLGIVISAGYGITEFLFSAPSSGIMSSDGRLASVDISAALGVVSPFLVAAEKKSSLVN